MSNELDLTLDSIMIPSSPLIPSLDFGTVVTPNPINHGGLSSREMSNNVMAFFTKMRPVVVSSSIETTVVQYDARLIINAGEPITLTLRNGAYEGCLLTIINQTSYTHTISCTSVSTNTPILLPNKDCVLIWNGTKWQNIKAPAIGKHVVQFPQEKKPENIYPCTKWEEIDYQGAFFRAYLANVSGDFISSGTITSQSLQPQGTQVFEPSANKGLYFEGSSATSENEDSHPKVPSHTSTHNHSWEYAIYDSGSTSAEKLLYQGNTASGYNNDDQTVNKATNEVSFSLRYDENAACNHNHTLSTPAGTVSCNGDAETRPDNYAAKIWKRIA